MNELSIHEHDSFCPKVDKIRVFCRCSKCGDEIYEGEKYIDESEPICMYCIDDMTSKQLLDLFGVQVYTVAEDSVYE